MNIFKLMQAMRPYIQSGEMTYDLAIKYLKERGVQFDGLVKKALDNMFKKIKARDPVFDKNVTKMPFDDEGLPFDPKTLKTIEEKRKYVIHHPDEKIERAKKVGIDNLFEETKGVNWKDTPLPVNPKVESFYDELVENAYKESKKTGRDVQTIIEETIDYKFTGNETGKEILDIIEKKFFKADGGRIGFNQGGNLGLTEQAQGIYDSWISAGHSEEDTLAYLESRGMYNAPVVQEGIIKAPNIINQNLGGDGEGGPPPGPTFNRNDLLGTSDYQGTGPGFIESILGIPAALANAYTKVSPMINFAKNIFKPRVQNYVVQPSVDAIAKADEERKAKAAAFLAEQQRTNIAQQLGGPDGQSGGKYAGGDAFASANPYGGRGTKDDMGADSFAFKKGGLATMFTRRR